MNSKIPCEKCSVMILPTTAAKNEGLCMRCKTGNRENIENAKKYYAKERELDKTCPFRAFWRELVSKVHDTPNGFEQLTIEEKQYFAVSLLDGEVHNGGFDQYFFNSSSEYYKYAELGLIKIDAKQILTLLRKAKVIAFGNLSVPKNTVKRREHLENMSKEIELNSLDTEYYASTEDIGTLLESFALESKLVIKS